MRSPETALKSHPDIEQARIQVESTQWALRSSNGAMRPPWGLRELATTRPVSFRAPLRNRGFRYAGIQTLLKNLRLSPGERHL